MTHPETIIKNLDKPKNTISANLTLLSLLFRHRVIIYNIYSQRIKQYEYILYKYLGTIFSNDHCYHP